MLGRTNTGGGGSGGLNFKVICNPQPSTAKENTIWVDTDRINNCYFSATQPENMVEYDVWFYTSTYSPVEFNALKKNGIQVYPLSAKQMVSGALKDVTAKSYQGGEWVDWIRYLYNVGDECTSITGGWVIVDTASNGSVTKNSKSITLDATGVTGQNHIVVIYTAEKIDVSDMSKISVNDDFVKNMQGNAQGYFGLYESQPTSYSVLDGKGVACCHIASWTNPTAPFQLPVGSISGEYYVVIGIYVGGEATQKMTLDVKEVTYE